MFGRIIDSLMRLSLIMRGKVPGGFAAAAHVRFQEAGDRAPTYYVRAVRDAGYLVLQYWVLLRNEGLALNVRRCE